MTAYTHSTGGISMCIYTITHKESGRVYVGQTRGKVSVRWRAHCAPSRREKRGITGAIKKHGASAFSFSVIDVAETCEQLNHKERFWISSLGTLAPRGFNLEAGGNDGKAISAESRQRRQDSFSRWLAANPDRSSFGNGSRGRKRRPEEIAAIKTGLMGRPVSDETKEKIAAKQRGVPKTREYVLRMARGRMKGMALQRNDGVVFLSYLEAEESLLINRSAIHAAANGKHKTCGGYSWTLIEVSR